MKLAIIAAIAIVVAPIAQAQTQTQTVCEEVERINTSGISRFDSIEGPYLPDGVEDEISESNATLFGAEDCVIDQYFEPRHTCAWEFATEADLLNTYAERTAVIQACLEGWERSSLLVSDPSEPGYRILAGVGYLGAGEYEVMVWEIVADFDPGRESGRRYRLSMTAIDYTL